MTALALFLAFFIGFYLREVLDTLKSINARIERLHGLDKPKPNNQASFAEPMTRAEFIAQAEQEKVDALNK